MQFLNDEVDIKNLPAAEQVALSPIEPAYLKVLRWEWRIAVFILLAAITLLIWFVKPLRQQSWIIAFGTGWLVLALASWFLQLKSFQSKAYALREKDILFRSGWIFQHIHACPFNRVQHSLVAVGPLEKRFGLATLVLFTAGSNEADLRIPGLREENAWALKEWITKKIDNESADHK
jgi:membrane protein YdbS with pleckstrin-like domain